MIYGVCTIERRKMMIMRRKKKKKRRTRTGEGKREKGKRVTAIPLFFSTQRQT